MIVAIDVSHIQRRRGGIGQYALALLKDLLAAHSPHRFTLHGWSFSLDTMVLRELVSDSVQLRAARVPGSVKRLYWDRIRVPPVGTYIGAFDVFHSMDPFAPPTGGRPFIVTVHDVLSRTHPRYFTRSIIERDRRIGPIIGRAAGIIVPSEDTRRELISSRLADPSRIEVAAPSIPAVFSERPEPGDGPLLGSLGVRAPYVLSVGTIEPRKNIEGLLKAFEILCDRGPAPDLVIAGKLGWMSGHIPALLRSSRHAAKIRHLDFVSEAALASLYRHALCFVYPSFAEGYGRPVAEAMASGVPVITSDSSGMAEIAGEGAALVDPFSTEQLVETLGSVTTSAPMREQLRARGLTRADELRKTGGVEAVLRLYEKLVRQ